MMKTRAIAVLILLSHLSSCKSPTESHFVGYLEYLEDLGYSIYNPPRSDRGASSVFAYQIAESGKVVLSPVCRKLFSALEPKPADLTIPSSSRNDQLDAGFALELLKDMFSKPPSIEAGVLATSKVDATFGKTTEYSIAEEDLYNEQGVARTITPQCFSALRQRARSSGLGNVFVVQSAIQVDTLSYELEELFSAQASAEVEIKKVLNVIPSASGNLSGNTTLSSDTSRYVAFIAFKITDYVDTGLTTAGSAIVKAERLTF